MSSLQDDETSSIRSVDHDLVLLSKIFLECLIICRGIVCPETSDLYSTLRSALRLAVMLSDVDEIDLCSEHSTFFSETGDDPFPPRLPRRLRRRPPIRYRPWPRYRYPKDTECSRSDTLADCDSVTSDCSSYEPRRYIPEPLSSLGMVRPRKWLSLFLGLDFLDVFKRRKESSLRREEKKSPRMRPSRVFVVDPPEDQCEADFRRERRTLRTRYRLPRMNSEPIPELRRGRQSGDDRPRTSENREPREYRFRREVSIVAERRPLRQGRRTSPERTFEVREITSFRESRSYWAQQVDRESARAFRETPTRRYTRVEEPMPNASTSAERGRNWEIRLPRQGGYACPNNGPEPTTIIHRTPRPRARSPWPPRREDRNVEERAPRIAVEERSPRTQPRIVQYGVGGLVDSGIDVLIRAQSRRNDVQVRDDTRVETETNRNTRRNGERTLRSCGSNC